MGPILAAKSKLDDDIKAGREKPDTTLKANWISMTDPDHLYPAYVRRIAPSAETITEDDQYKNRHIVKVTLGFTQAVQKEYLERNKTNEMRPGAEVRARVEMRHDQSRLLPAPQADPGASTNRSCSAGRFCIERIERGIELINHQISCSTGSRTPYSP